MFEVKPRAVDKRESSTETDEGLGSSRGRCSSGSAGSGSIYLSDSQDWAVSPDAPPRHNPAISPLLAEETFRYMTYLALEPPSYSHHGSQSFSKVLSADRVEQMTKTYNDMDVVTHLLSERDRDLELAARIGQSLLQRNHLLQQRNEAVEEQLAQAFDQVHQLQHELSKKDELLRMVASASEESETDSSCSTPHRQPPPQGNVVTAASALSQLESLQGKLQELEEENLALRSEACHLKHETVNYEEKEQQLVSDCVKELRESNSQMVSMTDELSQKNEELMRHQEEIAQLLSQIVELQHRVKELALEKEELRIHLQASKEAQKQLTAELNELTETNAECLGMLHESQEEIKELRNRSAPSAGMRRHPSYGLYPMDSLAAEIEGTMRRELSVEEEAAVEDQRVSQKRVFQAVRSANTSVAQAPSIHAVPPIPGSGCSSLVMTAQPFRSAQGEEACLGRPGSPGGGDLNNALHRLSLRRHNFLCERQFFRAERERKLQALAGAESEAEGGVGGGGRVSPAGSTLSSSSYSSLPALSLSSSAFRTFLPEKLQIVKPMEGSLTLHHWQQLAQPHLGTILDPHPGVVTKGFRSLPQDSVYHLTDLEEDEEEAGAPPERGAAAEEEEEEEVGITFQVRCSSTPEDRKERKRPVTPASPKPSPSPSSSLTPAAPAPLAQPVVPGQSERPLVSGTSTALSFSGHNPGKCQSATSSTYTFTTCRILHPSDITTVTTSSSSCLQGNNTPSSLRTGPSTPVTPCRLSLGDSFPPRRAAPSGLTQLVLERGISSAALPPPEQQPLFHLLPGTPPNSPSLSPAGDPAPAAVTAAAAPASDNFLASRPAELFLQDVYGLNLGRAPHPRLPSPSGDSPAAVSLVDRLRQLGFSSRLRGPEPLRPHRDSSTFVAAGGGSLLDGLRRNQSLPAMIGARASAGHASSRRALPSPNPPPHPTTLALHPASWGRRRPASLSHPPSSSVDTTHS